MTQKGPNARTPNKSLWVPRDFCEIPAKCPTRFPYKKGVGKIPRRAAASAQGARFFSRQTFPRRGLTNQNAPREQRRRHSEKPSHGEMFSESPYGTSVLHTLRTIGLASEKCLLSIFASLDERFSVCTVSGRPEIFTLQYYLSWNYFRHCITFSFPQNLSAEIILLYIT